MLREESCVRVDHFWFIKAPRNDSAWNSQEMIIRRFNIECLNKRELFLRYRSCRRNQEVKAKKRFRQISVAWRLVSSSIFWMKIFLFVDSIRSEGKEEESISKFSEVDEE